MTRPEGSEIPSIFYNSKLLAMKASDTQIGGGHYKNMTIQPTEFIFKNNIPFIEGCVIKYICRHRSKNGKQDIEKAIHYLQLLMEMEYGEDETMPFKIPETEFWMSVEEFEKRYGFSIKNILTPTKSMFGSYAFKATNGAFYLLIPLINENRFYAHRPRTDGSMDPINSVCDQMSKPALINAVKILTGVEIDF